MKKELQYFIAQNDDYYYYYYYITLNFAYCTARMGQFCPYEPIPKYFPQDHRSMFSLRHPAAPECRRVESACVLPSRRGWRGTLQRTLIQRNRNVCDKTACLLRCWQI